MDITCFAIFDLVTPNHITFSLNLTLKNSTEDLTKSLDLEIIVYHYLTLYNRAKQTQKWLFLNFSSLYYHFLLIINTSFFVLQTTHILNTL